MTKLAHRIFLGAFLSLFVFSTAHATSIASERARLSSLAAVVTSLENIVANLDRLIQDLITQTGTKKETSISSRSAESLTMELLALKRQYAGETSGAVKQTLIVQMRTLIQSRNQTLHTLLEQGNSASVRALMLPATTIAQFPSDIQPLLEQDTTVEGTATVLHVDDFDNNVFIYRYSLKTSTGETIALSFGGKSPHFTTGAHIRVTGKKLDTTLLADDGEGSMVLLAAGGGNGGGGGTTPQPVPIVTPTFGAQKTLVIAVNFQDKPTSQPFTTTQIRDGIFGTISNFYRENSYNQAWLEGDVAGWYTIAMNSTDSWDTGRIQTLGDSAATAAGYNLSNYTHILYITDGTGGYGISSVGGAPSRSWTRGDITLKIAGHELGHGLSLSHSHALECGISSLCSTDSTHTSEYGDVADNMGSPNDTHLNVFQKERLGWLNYNVSPPITTVTVNGTYSITPTSVNDGMPKAIKILRGVDPITGGNQYLYAEYRQLVGFDADMTMYRLSFPNYNLTYGPLLHVGTAGYGNTSYLIDTAASSTVAWRDAFDSALLVGQTFLDPNTGVTLTTVSTSTTGTSISVLFGTPQCVHQGPTLTVMPSSQTAAPGSPLTYTVFLTNNDNSLCTSSTFTVTPTLPSGFTQSPASLSLAAAPGATISGTVTVTSSFTQAGGLYMFSETAVNSAATSYTGSAPASYMVDANAGDTTPPSTTITSPTNGATIIANTTLTLTASASDNKGVTRVDFYLKGRTDKFLCSDTTSPYSCTWSVPKSKNKVYEFYTKAYDAAGNVGVSPSVRVTAK